MSIKVMSQVWELDLPATDKLILLGFADHANDEGICRPSFARIAWKCGISKETVKRTVRGLRASGILSKIAEAGGPGCPAAWQIATTKGVRLTPFISDLERAKGGHGPGKRGSSVPGMGVTAMTSESKTGIEDLEPKSSPPPPRAQTARGARRTTVPLAPCYENFKGQFPDVTATQFDFAVERILSRAKTTPRAQQFWLTSLRNFFEEIEAEADLFLTDRAVALFQSGASIGDVAESLKGEAAARDLAYGVDLIERVISQASQRFNRNRVLRSELEIGAGPGADR